jgi:hypothetical protein
MIALSSAGWAGTPDEVACVAALLMDPDGGFINGSDFLMDGGVTATLLVRRTRFDVRRRSEVNEIGVEGQCKRHKTFRTRSSSSPARAADWAKRRRGISRARARSLYSARGGLSGCRHLCRNSRLATAPAYARRDR